MKILQEFKTFAIKGNVIDMAVGIIIGAAFGKIVTSLVNDIIMPPIGLLIGGIDFGKLTITLKEAVDKSPAVVLKYGEFINILINFLLVAWAVFMLIKGMNSLKKKEEAKPAPPPAPKEDIVLLSEIRDILKSGK